MLFNSGVFLQFFAAFLLLYVLVRHHLAWRNVLIVCASYLFYGWWDYRFLSLLMISSLLDYSVGLLLDQTQQQRRRKLLLALSIAGNLTILGFFKYFDFFVSSLADLMQNIGLPFDHRTLGIVLPVGISFYTFQTMSYTIDVYRGQMQATGNLIQFLAYVSFFPQLVAGPIERARHLLPQFARTLTVTAPMLQEGLWLCIWGLFKKVVVADNLAPLVEMVYGNPEATGPMVVMATIAFGFQIYGDFSGYSDMARGLAKLLGFDLMQNFNLPYSAVNVRDFWRRWHISFSTWLRDYLYVSLGGNRSGTLRTHLNLLVTMLLGGLWHGAAWNFVLWGCWHGLGLMLHRAWSSRRRTSLATGKWSLPAWLATLTFVFYGWLLFRCSSWKEIVAMTSALADLSLPVWAANYAFVLAVFISPLIAMQCWQSRAGKLTVAWQAPRPWPQLLQGSCLIPIILYWEKAQTPFIYFQF